MMTNGSMAALLMNSRVMDLAKGSSEKSTAKGDDTFMNLLKEKMQTRDSLESPRPSMVQKTSLRSDREKPVPVESETAVKEPAPKPVLSKDTKVQEAAGRTKASEVSQKDLEEEELKKSIGSLEALVALLENLLARLDTETVQADPAEVKTPSELLLPASGSVDPMELLKALLEGNAEKLKALLGEMDQNQQTPEIKDLLENIQKLLEKLTKEKDGLVSDLSFNLEPEVTGASKKELMDQLKAQCSGAVERLKEKIAELKNSLSALQESENEMLEGVLPVSNEAPEDLKLEAQGSKTGNKGEMKTGEDKKKPVESHHLQELPHSKTELDSSGAAQQDFALSAQQKPQQASAMKIDKTPQALSGKPLEQTVTNQVMMKVKLMAGESKQEMEMHLKPESLGKLSLKIIHERGEILAKITAENEQVKGIIESNMQLLKDALEKSGLSVQSLSVSVGGGEHKGQSQNSHESSRTGSRLAAEKPQNTSISEVSYGRSQQAGDMYSQSSQIDLSA